MCSQAPINRINFQLKSVVICSIFTCRRNWLSSHKEAAIINKHLQTINLIAISVHKKWPQHLFERMYVMKATKDSIPTAISTVWGAGEPRTLILYTLTETRWLFLMNVYIMTRSVRLRSEEILQRGWGMTSQTIEWETRQWFNTVIGVQVAKSLLVPMLMEQNKSKSASTSRSQRPFFVRSSMTIHRKP